MTTIINQLYMYFQYPFVRYAMIVGLLIAVCASLLGVTLVLKRFSFIGDGLSHIAFGAMSVAAVTGITNNMYIVLPVTVITAILLLQTGQKPKIQGDALVAMLSVGALAIGYLLMNKFSASANVSGDVCGSLFGSTSILTLTPNKVILCVILSTIILISFVLLYNKIFSVTFDENFAKSTGINTDFYNFVIAVIIAVIVTLAMNLVGSLLISALVIFPALSAMRITKTFKSATVISAIIALICTFFGIIISILAQTPIGATIVIADIITFLICCIIGKIKN